MIANPAIAMPATMPQRGQYPLTFWCFVFFTFVVFVAPQNIYVSLQPLHLARVAFVMAVGVYLFQTLVRRQPFLPAGREFRLLMVYVAIAACSIPFSIWPGGSFELLTDRFAKSLLVCLLSVQLLTTLPRFRTMLWFTILFGIVDAVVAIVKFQQGDLVEGYRTQGAFSGLTTNPNDLALTLNLIIPFGLAFFSLQTGIIRKGVCAIFLATAFMAIIAAYSRGGIITLGVLLMLYAWKLASRGNRLKFAMPIALLVGAFFVLAPNDYDERLRSITDFSKDKTGSGLARWNTTIESLEIIVEHPLLGVGLGQNGPALNARGAGWTMVHNVYLQIASEIGIPGLIAFVLLVLALLKMLRQIRLQASRNGNQKELAVLATATEIALLTFCVAALFHPSAYHFYFYYIAGFALALKGIASRLPTARAIDDEDMSPRLHRWRMKEAVRHG